MKFNLIDVGCKEKLRKTWNKCIDNILTIDYFDIDGSKILANFSGKRTHITNNIFDTEENKKLYICKKKRLSSLYEPNFKVINETIYRKESSNFTVDKTIEVFCIRLDTVLETLPVIFNFLKVDCRGSELNVIKSMGNFLHNLRGIEVKCYKAPIYKDISIENEIVEFLNENNFELAKKIVINKQEEKVVNNCLFINKNLIPRKIKFIMDLY